MESDDDDANLLSQLIESQTYGESSQNIDAAYAIIESREQKAELEASNHVDPVLAANNAFWAIRNEIEPTSSNIPIPSNAEYASLGTPSNILRQGGLTIDQTNIRKHKLVYHSLSREHNFHTPHEAEQYNHVVPYGLEYSVNSHGRRENIHAPRVASHRLLTEQLVIDGLATGNLQTAALSLSACIHINRNPDPYPKLLGLWKEFLHRLSDSTPDGGRPFQEQSSSSSSSLSQSQLSQSQFDDPTERFERFLIISLDRTYGKFIKQSKAYSKHAKQFTDANNLKTPSFSSSSSSSSSSYQPSSNNLASDEPHKVMNTIEEVCVLSEELWDRQRSLLEVIDGRKQYQKALDLAIDMKFPLPSGGSNLAHILEQEIGDEYDFNILNYQLSSEISNGDVDEENEDELTVSGQRKGKKRKRKLKNVASVIGKNEVAERISGRKNDEQCTNDEKAFYSKTEEMESQLLKNKGMLSLFTAILAIKVLLENSETQKSRQENSSSENNCGDEGLLSSNFGNERFEESIEIYLSMLIDDCKNHKKSKILMSSSSDISSCGLDYERLKNVLLIIQSKLSEAYRCYPSHPSIACWHTLATYSFYGKEQARSILETACVAFPCRAMHETLHRFNQRHPPPALALVNSISSVGSTAKEDRLSSPLLLTPSASFTPNVHKPPIRQYLAWLEQNPLANEPLTGLLTFLDEHYNSDKGLFSDTTNQGNSVDMLQEASLSMGKDNSTSQPFSLFEVVLSCCECLANKLDIEGSLSFAWECGISSINNDLVLSRDKSAKKSFLKHLSHQSTASSSVEVTSSCATWRSLACLCKQLKSHERLVETTGVLQYRREEGWMNHRSWWLDVFGFIPIPLTTNDDTTTDAQKKRSVAQNKDGDTGRVALLSWLAQLQQCINDCGYHWSEDEITGTAAKCSLLFQIHAQTKESQASSSNNDTDINNIHHINFGSCIAPSYCIVATAFLRCVLNSPRYSTSSSQSNSSSKSTKSIEQNQFVYNEGSSRLENLLVNEFGFPNSEYCQIVQMLDESLVYCRREIDNPHLTCEMPSYFGSNIKESVHLVSSFAIHQYHHRRSDYHSSNEAKKGLNNSEKEIKKRNQQQGSPLIYPSVAVTSQDGSEQLLTSKNIDVREV